MADYDPTTLIYRRSGDPLDINNLRTVLHYRRCGHPLDIDDPEKVEEKKASLAAMVAELLPKWEEKRIDVLDKLHNARLYLVSLKKQITQLRRAVRANPNDCLVEGHQNALVEQESAKQALYKIEYRYNKYNGLARSGDYTFSKKTYLLVYHTNKLLRATGIIHYRRHLKE